MHSMHIQFPSQTNEDEIRRHSSMEAARLPRSKGLCSHQLHTHGVTVLPPVVRLDNDIDNEINDPRPIILVTYIINIEHYDL